MANQVTAIINSITREILFENSGVSAVELDGGLWTIKFKMDAVFGQDPSDPFNHHIHQIQVYYSQNDPSNYDDGYVDSVPPSSEHDDIVEFVWTPPLEATEKQGWLYFNVRIRNTDNDSTWSTKVKKIRVNPTVKGNADSQLTPTQSDKITELLARTETLLAAVAGDIDVSDLNTYLLAAHPVGSYYWSRNSTSPATLFGGTWEALHDVVLVAASDTHPAGSTGGAELHTLTVDEMPSHNHPLGVTETTEGGGTGSKIPYQHQPKTSHYYPVDGISSSGEDMIKSVGGGQAFSLMQPYRADYCWVRTA